MTYDALFYMPSVGPRLANGDRNSGGGAETQILLLTRALARRGLKVAVVAYPTSGSLPESWDGVDIIVRPSSKAHQRVVGKLREGRRIRGTFAAVDARTVVSRVANAQVGLAALAARQLKRNFVYSGANISDFQPGAGGLAYRQRVVYELGIRLANHIVVQTDEQKRLCLERFGREAIVIRSISDQRSVSRDPQHFLWVGRFAPHKNPFAFVELARSVPDASFKMVGVTTPESGDLPARVADQARALPNLELIAPLDRDDILDLVARSFAVVLTSEYEGMPNVFLEAWTSGVPTLTLRHDPDNVIDRFGLGSAAGGSQEKLVSATRDLWETGGAMAATAANCKAYIARFHSEESVGAEWERLLAEGSVERVVRGSQ